jgi:4-amino-4-deoxy-L-arabinose transferase-like glycosyltransferase
MSSSKVWFRWGLTALFAYLSAVYALLVPPFELPDEPDHLAYVNFVAERGALPNQYHPEQAVLREGHQPPLYYVLGAMLVRATQADHRVEVRPVPHRPPDPDAPEHIPIYRHVDRPIFPTGADRVGFYLLRLLSVLMAAVNLFVALRLFERLLPQPAQAVMASLLMVGLPQFAFISGGITNDNLANLMGTLTLYGFVRLLESPESLRVHAGIGLALGLGLLAKKSLLVLFLGWVLLMGWLLLRGGDRRRLAQGAMVTLGLVLLLAGGWFVRNALLYGDPLGNEMERRTLPELLAPKSLFSRYFLGIFWRVTLFSAIGIFGWMNVLLPVWVYVGGTLLLLVALVGLARGWRTAPLGLRWSLAWVLLSVGGLVWYNLTYSQPQGRLLFPVLPAGLALVAYGFAQWVPPARTRLALLGIGALGAMLHLLSLWTLYAFYYPPERYMFAP